MHEVVFTNDESCWEEGAVAKAIVVEGGLEEFPGFALFLLVAVFAPGTEEVDRSLIDWG